MCPNKLYIIVSLELLPTQLGLAMHTVCTVAI